MSCDHILPFKRGTVIGAEQSLGDGVNKLEGMIYKHPDTVHGFGGEVKLRVVKNNSGSAITVTRELCEFSTGPGDFGTRIVGLCDTEGAIAKPIDDAYPVGYSIPDDALFYVVEEGLCDILAGSTTTATALTIGSIVTSAANGQLSEAVPGANEHVLGRLDEDVRTATTAYRVYVFGGLYGEGT